jgi:flagellum-specific peptidoglycan hydrolase FlgJ
MSVASCTANKPIIQTTKNEHFRPYTPGNKLNKKQVAHRVKDSVKVDSSKTEILSAVTRVKVTPEIVLAYIEQYKEISKSNMTQFGIPSSIILAQGILESGAGTGPLSSMANNHFGIKCHKEWTGPSVKYDDDSEQECFRKYEEPNESYKDHALFLTSRPRYSELFKLNKDDYKAWATGLKAAGYATDPKYPEKLIGIIDRYQLSQYDSQVLGKEYVPANTAIAIVTPKAEAPKVEVSKENTVNKEVSKIETSVVSVPKTETLNQTKSITILEKKLSSVAINDTASAVSTTEVNLTENISNKFGNTNNDPIAVNLPKSGTYQVVKSDTLYSISKKFNLTVEDLKKKNNIIDNAISIGQYLIVE